MSSLELQEVISAESDHGGGATERSISGVVLRQIALCDQGSNVAGLEGLKLEQHEAGAKEDYTQASRSNGVGSSRFWTNHDLPLISFLSCFSLLEWKCLLYACPTIIFGSHRSCLVHRFMAGEELASEGVTLGVSPHLSLLFQCFIYF